MVIVEWGIVAVLLRLVPGLSGASVGGSRAQYVPPGPRVWREEPCIWEHTLYPLQVQRQGSCGYRCHGKWLGVWGVFSQVSVALVGGVRAQDVPLVATT